MTQAQRFLSLVTLRQWLGFSGSQRAVATDALLEVVPPALTLASLSGHSETPLPFFVHQPTLLGFYLVFGERFVMGTTQAKLEALGASSSAGRVDDEEDYRAWEAEQARAALRQLVPARPVDAAPFLVAESVLDANWLSRFGLTELREPAKFNRGVLERLELHGWRLPSEAELDLAGRLFQAGPSSVPLGDGWCGDGWHPTYDAAPSDARPWGHEATVERVGVGRARFEPRTRRARARPAFSLLEEAVGYGPLAREARARLPPWELTLPP